MHNPFKFLSIRPVAGINNLPKPYCWHLQSLWPIWRILACLCPEERIHLWTADPRSWHFSLPFFLFLSCSYCVLSCSCNKWEGCWCVILTRNPLWECRNRVLWLFISSGAVQLASEGLKNTEGTSREHTWLLPLCLAALRSVTTTWQQADTIWQLLFAF